MKGAGGEVSSFSTRIHMFWEGIGLSKEALQDSDKYCTNYKGVAVIEPYVFKSWMRRSIYTNKKQLK